MNRKHFYYVALFAFSIIFTTTTFAREYLIDQQNKTFKMADIKVEALTINSGDTIRFKNEDPFFHNIFSLSELNSFDLGSFPKGESKVVSFDKVGKMEIECAIHPEMYLEVTIK